MIINDPPGGTHVEISGARRRHRCAGRWNRAVRVQRAGGRSHGVRHARERDAGAQHFDERKLTAAGPIAN
jgi:hypothetical protein